jgi:hypothetical protein
MGTKGFKQALGSGAPVADSPQRVAQNKQTSYLNRDCGNFDRAQGLSGKKITDAGWS